MEALPNEGAPPPAHRRPRAAKNAPDIEAEYLESTERGADQEGEGKI